MRIGIYEILRSSGSWRMKTMKLADYLLGTIATFCVPRRTSTEFTGRLQRMLVIRPGGIGDAIFLLPFLRQLKAQYPELIIDTLGERRNAKIFLSQPKACDHVYLYDRAASFFSLFKNHYDVVIDTEQWHYLSGLTAYALRPQYSVGFATRPLRAKLFHFKSDYGMDDYEILNFARLFSLFIKTEQITDINNCYDISEETLAWAKNDTEENSVTLFLGGSIPQRRLSLKGASLIINAILKKGLRPILLGGRDVEKASEALEKAIDNPLLWNCVGKISLEQSAALIKQSRLFIGTDSGLMHLACAVGTPVVALFGPGNVKKWGPKGERHKIIRQDMTCSPCTTFGYTVSSCKNNPVCAQIPDNIDFTEFL